MALRFDFWAQLWYTTQLCPTLLLGFMVFKSRKNRLAKADVKGVAPKSHLLNIRSLRLRGFKRSLKIARLALPMFVVLYLLGYQPVIGFPPIQRSVVHAQEQPQQFQEVKIEAGGLSHPFTLPHIGYISTYFSSWHPGIDIAVGLGTPIHPVSDGTVAEVHYDFFGLGHYVVIQHDQGIRSTYAHMGRIYVKEGDKVTPDNIIGEVGLTGHTSGPHTHLEITKNGSYINPQTILPSLEPISAAWAEATGSAHL